MTAVPYFAKSDVRVHKHNAEQWDSYLYQELCDLTMYTLLSNQL
jgi:hypothetical protein